MMSQRRILSALVVGVLFIAGCGDDNTADSGSKPSAGTSPVDRAFARQMIPHHESAVQMAQIAQRRGSSTFVKRLADDIVRTQTAEISTLRAADRRLKAAGVTVGSLGVPEHRMGMSGDPASLKSAKPFDPAFLKMMIPHHEGAIEMANAELGKGKDPQLKELAKDIISAQRREIIQMQSQPKADQSSNANANGNSRSASAPGMDEHGAGH